MSNLYNVSAAPHIKSWVSTRTIMQDVLIALVPASILGVYNFGLRALAVILVCVVASLWTEYIYEKGMKKPVTVGDFSAIVTGLLLALNLPASIPLWIAAVGSVFAILIVKQLYGGIGQNFMNPALAARCFLLISFGSRMNDFKVPVANTTNEILARGAMAIDGVTGATPLAALKGGTTTDLMDMFLGNIGGTIGETSAIAILIGAAYLLFKRVISWRIPVTYILTFVIFMILFGGKGLDIEFLLTHVLGGGLLLGAFFMATDYSSSPITRTGKIVLGIFLGIITGVFRTFSNAAEGVSYAIILGNLVVPLIDKVTMPRYFGKGTKVNG